LEKLFLLCASLLFAERVKVVDDMSTFNAKEKPPTGLEGKKTTQPSSPPGNRQKKQTKTSTQSSESGPNLGGHVAQNNSSLPEVSHWIGAAISI